MLNSGLLCFSRRAGIIRPKFLPEDGGGVADYAAGLLEIYRNAAEKRLSRGELDDLASQLAHTALSDKAAGGLLKVLSEHCVFASASEEYDYAGVRRSVFEAAPANLAAAGGDFKRYADSFAALPYDLYGDLPELEILDKAPDFTAEELIFRYNMELASSFMLYASSMKLEAGEETEAADLRRLFKYLKFFRLAAGIVKEGKKTVLNIEGPAAIFTNTRKYALQLASFLPAAALLKKWKLTAELKMKSGGGTLALSDRDKLKSHYRSFSKYVPEEIRMFHRLFEEKVPDFKVIPGDWRIMPSGEVVFPDLCFEHISGRKAALELFHRFHGAALPGRLAQLTGEENILIGVDRFLAADEAALAELVRDCPERVRERVFLFRDFPGVAKVHSLLKKFI